MPNENKFIDIADLDNDQFIGVRRGNEVIVKLKIDPSSSNLIAVTSAGLKVELPAEPVQYWSGTAASGIRPHYGRADRLRLHKKGGFGLVRIDIDTTTARDSETLLATFPATCPVFDLLVEQVVFFTDAQGRTQSINIWMDAGSRELKANKIPANKRLITTLTGFLRG